MEIIFREQVPFVFTSAGNPRTWTSTLKKNGIGVVHVVSSAKFAQKAADAGADAVVAEGFEAGGHNGREETTTFCLIPQVVRAVDIPVIAAGGIATGASIAAALVLGADGVQLGTRFVASVESSAHPAFKQAVLAAGEGNTTLTLKELTPVRLLHNGFYAQLQEAYSRGASAEELRSLLGRGRAKRGMFEGDLDEGELEIGQISGLIDQILPTRTIIQELVSEYSNTGVQQLGGKYCWE
jgi:enoyl-[acyl-carrier protein] reductase II